MPYLATVPRFVLLLVAVTTAFAAWPIAAWPIARSPIGAAPDRGRQEDELRLSMQPKRCFWVDDVKSADQTESCFFVLTLASLEPALTGATIELHAGGKAVKSEGLTTAYLDAIVQKVEARKLRYLLLRVREPKALQIDAIRIELRAKDSSGAIDVAPERYACKTALTFPFQGPGVFTQTWVNENGHSNATGQFALDALGLTADYAPQLSDETKNEAYAGWGRAILAPGAGVVVAMQNAIPDQARPEHQDPATYRLPSGASISHGNHVTIDHENGEFSTVAHMQLGSVCVKLGDRVSAGQPIGKLGNSGNTFGPHVHYQLHDGIDLDRSSGLPCRFTNVSGPLTRGRYFAAK